MPILDQKSFEFISRSPDQTRRVGMRLGTLLEPGDVIGLIGDLGSGKTTLVQGISAGWGSLDTASSPTFILVNVYRKHVMRHDKIEVELFYHLDAYRLEGEQEAIDLDLDALINQGPLVVEWANRIEKALPEEILWINLRWVDENQRDILFSAVGDHYQKLLDKLRTKIFGVI
jgi:tRNA threonylcarbamoyladenosine biosynthesis protein TsaE